jgi:hypothetical protein
MGVSKAAVETEVALESDAVLVIEPATELVSL